MKRNPESKIIAKKLCRELRRNATKSEKILWEVLRNRGFQNKKYYRQYPIFFEYDGTERFFVADFYCHEDKEVIEIDGKIHDYQKDYDELRTFIINSLGMKVMRFKNEEIENDLKGILDKIGEG